MGHVMDEIRLFLVNNLSHQDQVREVIKKDGHESRIVRLDGPDAAMGNSGPVEGLREGALPSRHHEGFECRPVELSDNIEKDGLHPAEMDDWDEIKNLERFFHG